MRQRKELQLLTYLQDKGSGIVASSAEIMSALNVSKRQVQKYIASINKNASPAIAVLSGHGGYSLNPEIEEGLDKLIDTLYVSDTPESRRSYILQKVISAPGEYDVFDFAEALCVSVPTIEADLQRTRQYVKSFELTLEKKEGKLCLDGKEKSKRALMRTQLFQTGYRNFILNDAIQSLSYSYNLSEIFQKIQQAFLKYEIFVNDYAVNNIALHAIIMVERVGRKFEIDSLLNKGLNEDSSSYKAAHEIVVYLEQQYDVKISNPELYNLTLVISNNSSVGNYAIVNAQNVDQYIDSKYIEMTRATFRKIEKTYHLDAFNEEFIATFSIHIRNLFMRIKNAYMVRNPLTENIKLNYPLIYDIAVYTAQVLHNEYVISINEDEIAFFALHIGGYFENNALKNTKVTCVFAYSDYYGFYQSQAKRISELFKEEINIIAILPVVACQQNTPEVDLIISMENVEYSSNYVVVNPFLTDKDVENLRKNIKRIIGKKKKETLRTHLTQLFHSDIFFPDIKLNSRDEIIEFLTQDVIRKGYANENFTKDVFAREKLSPTSFNEIAVPHSFESDTLESFIAFATCKNPVSWGDKRVSFVVLIGVTDERRRLFSEVFDLLIDILSETKYVHRLIAAKNYNEFLQILLDTI